MTESPDRRREPVTSVALREYVEALVHEHQRAIEIAEREREKAALALRGAEHRATDAAEREREKAANILASELRDRIFAGDTRLAEHIQQQIGQIAAALESARREQVLVASAAKEAIEKAEKATEKRFDAVNAFRAQLSDQANAFMPREVVESQIDEIRKQLAHVNSRLDQTAGRTVGAGQNRDDNRATTGQLIAALGVLVAFMGLIIVGVGAFT